MVPMQRRSDLLSLQLLSDHQGCIDRFGQYELHDLVVLDQQTTGVIIGVEKDSCQVLTSEVGASFPEEP